jgi:hypothetical protein
VLRVAHTPLECNIQGVDDVVGQVLVRVVLVEETVLFEEPEEVLRHFDGVATIARLPLILFGRYRNVTM